MQSIAESRIRRRHHHQSVVDPAIDPASIRRRHRVID